MALSDQQWLSDALGTLKGVGLAVGGAVAAAFALRRRFAKDNSDIAREKSETRVATTLLSALQAERDAAALRLKDMQDERDKQFGACEERVRSLSEQVLDLRLANGRLMQELALHDKEAADRLLVLQVRPAPPGPGDEPP